MQSKKRRKDPGQLIRSELETKMEDALAECEPGDVLLDCEYLSESELTFWSLKIGLPHLQGLPTGVSLTVMMTVFPIASRESAAAKSLT